MDELVVLPSALKHGLDAGQIEEAWDNFVARRSRGDDVMVSIGFSGDVEVEIFHADVWAADGAATVATLARRYVELVEPHLATAGTTIRTPGGR